MLPSMNKSEAAKKRFQDPAQRALMAKKRRAYLRTPEGREAFAGAMKRAGDSKRGRAGSANGLSRTAPEYGVWSAMVQRCTNPNSTAWKDYGGRGIRVDAAWLGRGGFARFLEHVGPRPSDKHTIGRKENDGHYEPGNVRWETRGEQMANWSRNRKVTINGVTKHVAEWAREAGVSAIAFSGRLDRGWPETSLLDPPRPTGRRKQT